MLLSLLYAILVITVIIFGGIGVVIRACKGEDNLHTDLVGLCVLVFVLFLFGHWYDLGIEINQWFNLPSASGD